MNRWIAVVEKKDSEKELFRSTDVDKLHYSNCTVFYKRDGRFVDDQIFSTSEQGLIILDGVLLNKAALIDREHAEDLADLLGKLYRKDPDQFYSVFTGPFCGVSYVNKNLIAFSNQTGDAPLFYYCDNQVLLISNDLNLIVESLKRLDIEYHLNEEAALHVMTFGYMIDDITLIKEIKRLGPGKYLKYTEDGLEIHTYYAPIMKDVPLSEEEAVEKIDSTFRKAVKRCFDKDLEYGYKRHLADMSGGLDSRMVSWVAKDMGYENVVNISYSQSDSDEYKDAALVSRELGNMFMHEQMDDASFLLDADRIVDMQYGSAVYYGITGGERLLRSLSFDEFGLEHTGQLGDVILGAYTQRDVPIDTPYKRYSNMLDVQIPESVKTQHGNMEQFLMYTRGFLGVLSTHMIRRHYTYAVSPFLDIDFLNTCFSLPLKIRRGGTSIGDGWTKNTPRQD